ncbi:MAG: ribonuclease R [Lautropia sp. SCN 69-89]|nr:MAG: ribonuclease R [Lautropia sp. SCN 69-89]
MSRRQTPTTWFAPTREAILECLRAADVPMTPAELAERLEVPSTHFDNLNRRLLAMERDGQLLPNRKGVLLLASKLDLVAGRVQGHRDGFGFLIPDAGGPDVFLSPREMQKAMHGDRVLVKRTGYDSRGRPEGRIVEVTERAHRRLVGRFLNERGVHIVVPEDQRIKHDILIPPGDTHHAQHGQVVTVEIVDPPSGQAPPIGRVVEVLGEIGDPGMEIEIAVRKFDVPHQFGEAAVAQAAKLPGAVRPADLKGRVDLRDVPLVTIDGEDARDFDDAVYCEPIETVPSRGESVGAAGSKADEAAVQAGAAMGRARRAGGFRLIVAIADVAHYVKPGEPLDQDALERSTSVYFPRRVIPMLPEKLSNGLCSLNPQVDRLVLVCDMVISARGQIRAYQFYEAVMHSAARLTYDEVWGMLSGGAALAPPPSRTALLPMLRNLHELYRALAVARQGRGAIDLETVETKIVCDPAGRIERIVPSQRNDAHRLIEECMLAANVCTADFMRRSKHPGLFRVHEGPTPERLQLLREFLRSVGLALGGGDEPTPRDYAELAAQVRARPDSALLQTMLLRSMQQAVYSPDNIGHFGLAYDAYTHFTSPIRRYPDLLTHRVIKSLLAGGRYRPALVVEAGERELPGKKEDVAAAQAQARQLEHENWQALGAICSANERRADEASRDVEAWLKCMYVRERVGEQFAGRVTGVAPFGVFVTLNDLYVEGLVHVSELGGEYFQYNESAHELRGERTGRRFRLTDELDVQVSRVDLEARRIDFRLVERLDFRAISRIRRREAADDGGLRPDAVGAVTPPPEEMAAPEPGRPVRGRAAPPKAAGSKAAGGKVRKAAKPKSEKVKQARAERLAARSRRAAPPAGGGARRKRHH